MANIARQWSHQVKRQLGKTESQFGPNTKEEIEEYLLQDIQRCYKAEIEVLKKGLTLTSGHLLAGLSPFVDHNGLLSVGGRLQQSQLHMGIKCLILFPRNHPGSKLLVLHYHGKTCHQGRYLTLGALRAVGFHVEGARGLIQDLLAQRFVCQRLRGRLYVQKMSNLPPDRLEMSPPFTNTGLDAFGPFFIHEGKGTRKTKEEEKIWGLLFTCLASRAILRPCWQWTHLHSKTLDGVSYQQGGLVAL